MSNDPTVALTSPAGRDAWASLVTHPEQGLVALDYDGTLAPIVARPEDARAQPGIVDALVRLAEQGIQVAVITGRPVDAALSLGGLAAVPKLVILETKTGFKVTETARKEQAAFIATRIREILARKSR